MNANQIRNASNAELVMRNPIQCSRCNRNVRKNQFIVNVQNNMYCQACYRELVEPPESDGPSKIAIIFVAHDGVMKGNVWSKWRYELPQRDRRRIIFVAQVDKPQINHSPTFSAKYIPSNVRYERSSWGHISVVRNEKLSLKYILETHPLCKKIYIISGACVPILPAKKWLQNLDNNPWVSELYRDPQQTSSKFRQDKYVKRLYTIGRKVTPYFNHSTMSLIRPHAELVCTVDINKYFAKAISKVVPGGGPDEYIIGAILKGYNVISEIDTNHITSQFEYENSRSLRAVTWKTLNEPTIYMAARDQPFESVTLKDRLEYYRNNSDSECFRKIDPDVRFRDVYMPWGRKVCNYPIYSNHNCKRRVSQYDTRCHSHRRSSRVPLYSQPKQSTSTHECGFRKPNGSICHNRTRKKYCRSHRRCTCKIIRTKKKCKRDKKNQRYCWQHQGKCNQN